MPTPSRLSTGVVAVVDASRRQAAGVIMFTLAVAVVVGLYAIQHIGIDTDTGKLMSPNLAWEKADAALSREFPENDDLIAIVVDGDTPDLAEDAAAALARRLAAMPNLFRNVRNPAGGRFFQTEGLLFLPRAEVQSFADDMVAAQPMLGALAADPSARGVFDALDLFAQGAQRGAVPAAALDRPFRAVTAAVNAAVAGTYAPLSWQTLLSDRKPTPQELRQFVLAQPVLDFGAVEPGARAIDAVRAVVRRAGFVPARGVTVSITGPVALSDDQLAALKEGAGLAAGVALALLVVWLILAVRSVRMVGAILLTLAVGLVLCTGFAVSVIGPFNPISIAFAPLFIGIAIDFGIQFSVRFAAERETNPDVAAPLWATASGVGVPLIVAAAATAAGFFSLAPTSYRGVSTLGVIAGAGMVIALVLNLTFLPALLAFFKPRGFREAEGFAHGAALDRWFLGHRRLIVGLGAAAAVAAAFGLRHLSFDFDPINLENPRSESVRTIFELARSSDTTPYTLDVLAPTAAAASQLAERISRLPAVSQAIWLGSFVPPDQQAKLDILSDARDLLLPTLTAVSVKPPPTPAEVIAAANHCAADVAKIATGPQSAAGQMAAALRRAAARGPAVVNALEQNLVQGAATRIEAMRLALSATPVTLATIPAELRGDWVGTDGQYRIQVFPRGNARDPAVLRQFVSEVRRVAPNAAGMPVDIRESAKTVIGAFEMAGWLAVGSITLILFLTLRHWGDVAAVLVPLLLAGLLTLGTSAATGMVLNFANIVTLPLLLGIGVAFDIYFVLRWRRGEAGLLGSPTARAIVFSALTTGTAFGSLVVSQSPGIADMGKLLSLGLFFTLVCTLFVLPALLGPPPRSNAHLP